MITQICIACKISKNLEDFAKGPKKSGRTSLCRECNKEYYNQWYNKNKSSVSLKGKKYRSRPEIKERYLAYDRARHALPAHVERVKEYYKRNPHVSVRNSNKRRERLLAARGGEFNPTRKEYLERIKFYNGLCAYCGKAPATELDHAIPISRGGTNFPSNIYPACRSCNAKKYNKILRKEYPVKLAI